MTGSSFNFKAYARNIKEKATKRSLKTTKVLLDANSDKKLDKKVLSDVRSEIHLVRRNTASTGQSVRA